MRVFTIIGATYIVTAAWQLQHGQYPKHGPALFQSKTYIRLTKGIIVSCKPIMMVCMIRHNAGSPGLAVCKQIHYKGSQAKCDVIARDNVQVVAAACES